MAGVIKKKKSMFENEAALPKSPKSFSMREAEGGFVIDCYPEENGTKVAKTLAAAVKILKAHFGEASEVDEENEDD